MQNLFRELNITFAPLIEAYDTATPHYRIPLEKINPEITDMLLDLGIKVNFAECFNRGPGQHSGIHTDYNTNGEKVKVNWIYGGKDSTMLWYEPKPDVSGTNSITVANTNYTSYSNDDVTHLLTLETKPSIPYLIQAGTPHSVENFLENRTCISLVLYDMNGKHLKMFDAIKLLSSHIKY